MSVVNHLAEAAAVILLVELIVVILILAGVSGGLVFGLRWVRGKTGWAFGKANTYIGAGRQYLHKGTDFVAKPFIVAGAFADQVRGTARAIQEQVRRNHAPRIFEEPLAVSAGPTPAAESVEETEAPVPLV